MYQTATTQTGLSVKLHRLSVLFAAAMVWATSLLCSVAVAQPRAFEINAPLQTVMVGETLELFEARIVICADGHAKGFGFVSMATGEDLELRPIYAKLQFPRGSDTPTAAMIVFLMADLDSAAQPKDFVVGDWSETGEWRFLLSNDFDPTPGRLEFEATGTLVRTNERCEPVQFGQVPSRAKIVARPQIVYPFGGGDPLDFEAKLVIKRDNSASGFVDVPLSARGGRNEIFFGTILPHAELGFQFFFVGMLPSADPFSTNHGLRLTVTPNISDSEDCLIWDLVNGSTGETNNTATFDALTEFRVSRPRR